MKKPAVVFSFCFAFLNVNSQRVQTIVPGQVVAGNAFQIQYIINDPSSFIDIMAPQFDNLQLISGPNYYKGNSLVNGKSLPIENITYTVVPLKVGTIKINSITARFKNNEEEKSDEISIQVLPQPKASFNAFSTYTDINLYAPSAQTDLDNLIKANLFIKTEVDKKVCFLGEAITATFKLYSRLQSTSEVINAPSLYGFSVMDILNINEAHQAVETINGKIFNTSILRKLQLYPAQTGRLLIDEMQVQNAIEFNDSATGKKLKLEKTLASNPVEISVRSLPSKEPANYSGAVGQFTISADLSSLKIPANTQEKLFVTIAGKGNFIQFGPPVINWPKEFDVFEPVVSDGLNKNTAPTEGKRNYIFSFTTDQLGSFTIPPVSFSFFDLSLRQYKTASTDSIRLEVTPATKSENSVVERQTVQSTKKSWVVVLLITISLAISLLFWKTKKQKSNKAPRNEATNYLQRFNAISFQQLTDKQFYSEIQKLLNELSKENNLSQAQMQELRSIQNQCQLLIYADMGAQDMQQGFQKRVTDLLKTFDA